jgi:glycosyltransferase involved in cell wall biosynthesis
MLLPAKLLPAGSDRSCSGAWAIALAEDVHLPSGGLVVNVLRPCIRYVTLEQGLLLRRNWSGPASNLLEGLRKVADIVDIGIRTPRPSQSILLTADPNARCDAVLLIDYVAAMPEPFFIYFSSCLESAVVADKTAYVRAAGLFTESHWCASNIARGTGISRDKIHVVPPALSWHDNAAGMTRSRLRRPPRRKLLYISGHCSRGCCLTTAQVILDALQVLREKHDPRFSLTVAGMEEWPFPGSPPEGANFRGILAADEIGRLIDGHDLLVVPSSSPLTSLAFAEALSRGVPYVSPKISQFPEAVISSSSGMVVDESDPHELAVLIASILADDEMYRKVYERAPAMAAYFSWDRVARQITQIISREVGLAVR